LAPIGPGVERLAEEVAAATVNIQVGMGQGSGVVVTRDGYILTAAHVIGRPGLTATVTFPDGKKVKATSLGLARRLDFGMLRINEEDGDRFPYLDMGFSAELKQGQWVMAVGHPGGIDEKRGLVFRAGRIIANRIDKDVLQTDCTLVGGDSGGPLVDMNGKVVGIHSRIGSKLWDNLHAPIDVYSENWDRMDRGLVIDGAPHLGFKVRPSTNRVTSVETDGPAKKAGLKANDRIVEINGDKIESYEDLTFAIAKLRPYQKVSFKIKRRSKVIEMEVAVREKR
jgi:serine protease Do